MFIALERKIKVFLIIIIIMAALINSLTVNLTIRKNIYDHSVQLSQQHIKQQNQNLRLNMNLIEETSRLISENPVIKESLETTDFSDKVIPLLDSLRASNLNILGVTVYGSNGILYLSSNTYNAPKFEKVKDNFHFLNKLAEKNSYWMVRTKDIPSFYNYNSVSKTGIFTCAICIKNNHGESLGYLFVDTNINSIYDFYKPDDSGMFYNKSSIYIITSDKKTLTSPYNPPLGIGLQLADINMIPPFMDSSYTIEKNRKSIITYYPIPNSSDTVVIVTPLDLNSQLGTLITVLLVLGFSFVLVSFLLIKILSKSIIYPLTRLYESMQK
ncbi:MAG TPA: hypothetical protein GXX36_09750 [Clostridiaceae bacterium]|nr:hypothetical protein [Clostridiaceae bacterium]